MKLISKTYRETLTALIVERVSKRAAVHDSVVRKVAEEVLKEIQSEQERTKRVKRVGAKHKAGRAPFGYQVGSDGKLHKHASEQAWLRRIPALVRAGRSYRQIAAEMEVAGIKLSHTAVARLAKVGVSENG